MSHICNPVKFMTVMLHSCGLNPLFTYNSLAAEQNYFCVFNIQTSYKYESLHVLSEIHSFH